MLTVKFGADEYTLKASWGAAREFALFIGDPLQLSYDGAGGKQVFSAESVVRAIWIGLKHSGERFSYNEVGDLCHQFGIVNYTAIAAGYLVALVTSPDADEDGDEVEKSTAPKL
jgi:hypothetical protein